MKMRMTLIVEYDADPTWYGKAAGNPEAMAAVDKNNFSDPFEIAGFLESKDFEVKVEVLPE